MSDPLATTPIAMSQIEASRHPLQFPTESYVRAKVPVVARDQEKVAQMLVKSGLDLTLHRGIKVPREYCRDPVVQKRLEGKNRESVMFASDTSVLNVRHSVPRLVTTAQEMYDSFPANFGSFPFAPAGIKKAAFEKAMLSGGTQYTLQRLIEYGPKREAPPRPFEVGEVVSALIATGRKVSEYPEGNPAALTEQEVKVNADSDNGFPVGSNMRDPEAQRVVLELAGKFRDAMRRHAGGLQKGYEMILERFPEFVLCKGKTKTDVYKLGKATSQSLRFYNVVPRHLCILIQAASQPLSELWKKQSAADWRTGIGKGFAMGRADELVRWFDERLSAGDGTVWSHTGDDTLVVRRREGRLSVFTLDCSAFDITQHHETTRNAHMLFTQQLKRVDDVAACVWGNLARERLVTIYGSIVARTAHWGPSGMPLQSEVNDTLMECLLSRLAKREWVNKEQLNAVVGEVAAEVGFKVRLESYVEDDCRGEEPLRVFLSKHPQLYLGYYLFVEHSVVRVVIDLPRFLAGMVYLTTGYISDKSLVGVHVALALAGYTLSFGMPPRGWEGMFEVLRSRAVAAVQAVGSQMTEDMVEREVQKHTFAGLPNIRSVDGLLDALRRPPEVIWLAGMPDEPERPLGNWADEPWVSTVPESVRPVRDQHLNQLFPAPAATAGTPPPIPDREREAREQRRLERERRRAMREEQRDKKGGKSRWGDGANPFYAEDGDESEDPDDELDTESTIIETHPYEVRWGDEWEQFDEEPRHDTRFRGKADWRTSQRKDLL